MPAVYATTEAIAQMRAVPGLRERAQRQLLGVVEAALELDRLQAGAIADNQAPLIASVGDCEIAYSLDLRNECAVILAAVPASAVHSADRFGSRDDWPPGSGIRRPG